MQNVSWVYVMLPGPSRIRFYLKKYLH